MRDIRWKKDIQVRWTITTNGKPEPIGGRDISIVLIDIIGNKRDMPFSSEGNTVIFTFYGTEQERLGRYTVEAWENRGRNGQNVVDKTKAFRLVKTTEEEGNNDDSNLKTETVDLGTSDFVIQFGNTGGGAPPYDDTELRNKIGNLERDKVDRTEISDMETRTHASETYALISSLSDFVKKETGKGLSSNDFTNELKLKLESLDTYDDTEVNRQITLLQKQIDTLVNGSASEAIESFNEIVSFLSGIEDTQSLSSILAGINLAISNVQSEIPQNISQLNNDIGYLTEHQRLKTINGETIIGDGNITIEGSGSSIEFNKPMPSVSIAGGWSYFNNENEPVESLSSSLNPTIERGYKAQFKGTYKWTANKESKKPTSVTSSSNWQDLPGASGVNSKEYVSNKISSNATIKAEISAPKTGLMIKGNDVVAAEGLDIASSRISINFKDRRFYGNCLNKEVTEGDLKKLSQLLVTSKSATIENVNTKIDNTYYVYAYPTSYGTLSSIMQGSYEIFGAFSSKVVTVTNDSGYATNYYVYISNNKGAFDGAKLNFK